MRKKNLIEIKMFNFCTTYVHMNETKTNINALLCLKEREMLYCKKGRQIIPSR